MRSNFDKAFQYVLKSEGGYSNDPDDPGGMTKWGITLDTFSRYMGKEMPNLDELTMPIAKDIYRKLYWELIRGDELPDGLDYVMFDTAVNCGPKQAVRFLQRAINSFYKEGPVLIADGILGPKTMAELKKLDIQALCVRILEERDAYYQRLVASNPKLNKFIKGWRNRLAEVAVNMRTFMNKEGTG